ncbi:FAD-dependent oxidoreductase [Polycladidibacter stylochi]|uniref:FAD-dependent oxidoreductase n=1 Tax=Polycladidibacter stylochi TaxID=1807766 RepID=UPI00082CC465|nr:FAD-dependent oxidoreductase [Pseudovibrio stylochi]
MRSINKYDVVVVGGGAAGVAASVGAARAGAKTLLVERNPYLGGSATHAGVSSFCGFYTRGESPQQITGGVGNIVLDYLRREQADIEIYKTSIGNQIIQFESEDLKYLLDTMLQDEGVDILLHTHLIGCFTENGKIGRLHLMDDEGDYWVSAKCFVDASGDANLARFAGAPIRWGGEDQSAQFATLMMRIENIPEHFKLTPAIIQDAIEKAIAGGMQGFSKQTGLILKKTGKTSGIAILPSYKLNSLAASELTKAEQNTRKQARAYIEAFRTYIPQMKDCVMVLSGPRLGIRESRRIIGKEVLTGSQIIEAQKSDNAIGRGAWPSEAHNSESGLADYIFVKEGDYYHIPIGVLENETISNMWSAGRTISVDKVAYSSIRVMGTCFVTGHAAGVAAALSSSEKRSTIKSIQDELKRQGAFV